MSIREANLEDTRQLIQLFQGSLRHMVALQPDVWREAETTEEFAQLPILSPDGMLYVWAENGELLGLVSVFVVNQEEEAIQRKRRYADLDTLYVRPQDRGRGIGTALYRAAAAWAKGKGCNALELMTLGENTAARRFYECLGLRERRIIMSTAL